MQNIAGAYPAVFERRFGLRREVPVAGEVSWTLDLQKAGTCALEHLPVIVDQARFVGSYGPSQLACGGFAGIG